ASNCEDPPLDLCIVLDKTKSVGKANYKKMLESVRTLISKYNVGPTKTRISIVTYDKKAQVRVSFKELDKQNKNALNSLLDSMKARDKLGGVTRTDLALETVGNEVFTTANGDRPNSPNVMIVFTDGGTHKKSKPYSEVLPPLVAEGVQRIAVGIGKKINSDELETIAGSPDRVVNAESFDKLDKELDEIREVSCRKLLTCQRDGRLPPVSMGDIPSGVVGRVVQFLVGVELVGDRESEDGNWSPWSNPGRCDKTCGGGVRVRKRTCTNPPPSGEGKKCKGPTTKTEGCNTQTCPPPPPPPCKEYLDVGVIIDSSNSIKPNDYAEARSFLQSLARRLQISEAGSHMALILFEDPQNINELVQKIGKLPHIKGGTRTDRALELAAENFFGWQETGDRPDVPNVLLVLTDGDTNEGSKPFSQVLPPLEPMDRKIKTWPLRFPAKENPNMEKAAGVRRIAIGIGNEIDKGELVQIAGNQQDVIQVKSYGELIRKLEYIMKLACEDQFLGSCGGWGPWGGCSKTCGSGFKVRRRQCPMISLHLKEQKTSCNTNLCPGEVPCEDSREDCPSLAAAGKCWKQAIGQQFRQTFTLWNQCKKSCRRCNVDTQCKDNDPYLCPWLAAKNKLSCLIKLKCGSSVGWGSWGNNNQGGGNGGGGRPSTWGSSHHSGGGRPGSSGSSHHGGGRRPGGWGVGGWRRPGFFGR
ncbi:unnamed protein product, partial [Porites lobata]